VFTIYAHKTECQPNTPPEHYPYRPWRAIERKIVVMISREEPHGPQKAIDDYIADQLFFKRSAFFCDVPAYFVVGVHIIIFKILV
jgi:hypothetical protein